MRYASRLTVIFIICLAVTSAFAQERRGAITGQVTDVQRGILQGARVELQPGGLVSSSDLQGQFAFRGIAPGQYKVTVTYLGFAPFSTDVSVSAGATARVDAALKVETVSDEILVRPERVRGEVEAINREREADNLLQVLPYEVITSLPNANIADAVGRLPSVSLERDEGEGKYVQIRGTEPRLSNVTVDGVHLPSPENVRNVKLDAIPADLVESVEINKTLSANQEADAIGGSVNLVTRTAADKPYFSIMGMGGYTPIAGGRTLQQFDATVGQRFGHDKRFGIMFGGSWDWNGRGIDDVEPVSAINPLFPNGPGNPQAGSFAGPNTYDQREYWYDRTRFGFAGSTDYRLSDHSGVYLRGIFSQFKDDGQDWIYSPTVGTFATPTLTNADGTSSFTHVTRKPAQRLFNFTTGGRDEMGRTLINYELSFGQARFIGFFPRASFDPVSGGPLDGNVQFQLNNSNPFVPVLTALNTNIFDPNQYALSRVQTGDNHTFERDVTGAISLARFYNAGSHASIFEMGVKVRDAHKSELDTQTTFDSNTNPLMSSFLRSFTNPNYYFGKYGTYGPTTDFNKIVSFVNANPTAFTVDTLGDQLNDFPSDFVTDERVTAGYVMNTINIGNSRVQAGVRIEATQDNFVGVVIPDVTTTTIPVPFNLSPGTSSYVDVLPSVQYQYRFPADTLLRLSYGMGISRPNFADLPPFVVFDPTVGPGSPSVSAGNPNLKPTHAQNFDVAVEHYLKTVGMIQAGFFYKYLTDPIFDSVITPVTSGPFAGQLQTAPVNGPHAHITGVEFAWQQHLNFLPGLLNGSGIRANYSYTASQTTFPSGMGRTDEAALLRQAPNNWNFDYTYDKGGISARMGLTHNDASIFAYAFQDGADGGIKGPAGDVYLYPHTQVDAQVSYWIPRGRGLQAIVSLLNLNNEVFGFYTGSEQFPIQREYYKRTYSFGIRWTPSRER